MKWVLLVFGVVLFAAGLYLLLKRRGDRAHLKLYGGCAYLGLCLGVLGGILLLEPVLSRWPAVVSWGAAFAIFLAAGGLLLRPGFGKKQ